VAVTGTRVSPQQVTVALEALEHDAARWARAARDLRAAADAAQGQVLDPAAFSFAGGAAADAYDALRTKTVTLLTQGAGNCDDIAAALRKSAATYAAEEAAGVHRLHGIY
jgi:hypothetical protein